MLGAQWVMTGIDASLADAARDLVAKIAQVVPEHLRPLLGEPALTAPPRRAGVPDAIDMARLRTSIRAEGKIALDYRDETGAPHAPGDLADSGGLFRNSAGDRCMVRTAQGLSPFPDRPDRGGGISRRALSRNRAPGCARPGKRSAWTRRGAGRRRSDPSGPMRARPRGIFMRFRFVVGCDLR